MPIRVKTEKGYTLIELIVSIVLIGIIASILVYVMVSIFGILQDNRIRKQLLLDGYNASAKFVREFELVNDESDLLIGNLNEIQFISNIDGLDYLIKYEFIGSELRRTVDAGSPAILCTNASGSFGYYYKNHTQVSPPLSALQLRATRRVRLYLDLSSGANTYSYVADAFPVNYRFSGGGS